MPTPEYAFGPLRLGPDQTRFRLWAPGADAVALELDGAAPVPMTAKADGWFECDVACGAGTRYRFRVADVSFPDPASRLQDRDVHDFSVVTDVDSFDWQHDAWRGRPWHETVLYELHPGLYGGFAGITQRLSGLARLGVTAIELMPIADFPGPRNWGYDGVLPYAPDTAYGTPQALRTLIDTAHGLGMMVFLDVVYNHFGPDGNYLGQYAGAFFRQDKHTPWGPAIDFSRPEVRRFFTENALYWLSAYRFDGLRLDAVHAIPDAGWLDDMAGFVRTTIGPERHVHLVLENDDNAAHLLGAPFDAQWNDDGHHALHTLLTGESDGYYRDYANTPEQGLARCLAEGFIYQGEASAHRGGRPRGEPSAHLPPTAFVLFLQNHDQIGNRAMGERLTTLLNARAPGQGPNPLAAAVALLLLGPQIPLLFMGEEFGSKAPFLYFTSHNKALAQAVREGRQREFATFLAFDGASLPDPNATSTFDTSSPFADHGEGASSSVWQAYYARLLELRHRHIIPRLQGARAVGARVVGPGSVIASWRMGDGGMLTLAINLASQPVDGIALPDGELIFDSRQMPDGPPPARDSLAAGSLLALLEADKP